MPQNSPLRGPWTPLGTPNWCDMARHGFSCTERMGSKNDNRGMDFSAILAPDTHGVNGGSGASMPVSAGRELDTRGLKAGTVCWWWGGGGLKCQVWNRHLAPVVVAFTQPLSQFQGFHNSSHGWCGQGGGGREFSGWECL